MCSADQKAGNKTLKDGEQEGEEGGEKIAGRCMCKDY